MSDDPERVNKNIVENDELYVLKEWLKVIKMDQYYRIFLQNGWRSLDIVQQISNKSELKQIGINNVRNQCLIMSQIRKFANPTSHE